MEKRNLIKKSILFVVGALLIGVSYLFVTTFFEKQHIKSELAVLPTIPLRNLDNTPFYTKELSGIKILVYINTDCNICHEQIEEFKKLNTAFPDLQIVAISEQSIDELTAYQLSEPFFTNKNHYLTHDYTSQMYTHFDIESTPHLLIYNSNNELLKQQKGFIKAENLIKTLTVE